MATVLRCGIKNVNRPETRSNAKPLQNRQHAILAPSLSVLPIITQHTHTGFTNPLSGTTRMSWYQKGKTNLEFTEARDSEWQWNPLDHMQVCTVFQTDNHVRTPPLSFLQAGCPSCCPTNSVKALKALYTKYTC